MLEARGWADRFVKGSKLDPVCHGDELDALVRLALSLHGFTDAQREIIRFHFGEQYSLAEIARVCGGSDRSISGIINRVREKLFHWECARSIWRAGSLEEGRHMYDIFVQHLYSEVSADASAALLYINHDVWLKLLRTNIVTVRDLLACEDLPRFGVRGIGSQMDKELRDVVTAWKVANNWR